MRDAYAHLAGRPIAFIKPAQPVHLRVINTAGSENGTERCDLLVYRDIFPGLPDPILMRLPAKMPDEELPAFRRVGEKQTYRFDVFGGSRLKHEADKGDYGTLIGIPIEASDFIAKHWLTSNESCGHAQCAFLPDLCGPWQQPAPDSPARGVKG